MAGQSESLLSAMLPKLETWAPLDDDDRAALIALPYRLQSLAPTKYIVREGDRAEHSCLLLSGFAFRSKIVRDGGRQILALHMRGDMVDLQNAVLGRADHNVQALTEIEIALIPHEAILRLAADRPRVGRVMWHDTLVDGSINREWNTNVGRRDATTRLAHLLCEFALRLSFAGLGEQCNYELPMTQEQLADCLGLTSVHVNRTLKGLEANGLITRTARNVRVVDWDRLAAVGDFNSAYLHVDLEGRSIDPSRP
ncbi:MAG: Crp/Fnr family transcriptional regulator [Alphaproteobacteria bacterium]|nr:Crp/Fnr family transcriptional regulator [Alphaproteobacteria bacterium]